MVVAACPLEDISDMPDLKTNEWLHEARQLLCITLEQQAKSLTSQCHATPSQPSQPTATINGDHSDTHAPPMGGTGSNSSGIVSTVHGPGTPSLGKSKMQAFPSPSTCTQSDR